MDTNHTARCRFEGSREASKRKEHRELVSRIVTYWDRGCVGSRACDTRRPGEPGRGQDTTFYMLKDKLKVQVAVRVSV